ncbi:hypothetical protein Ctob_003641 [Chrysochromulina tobinii]|uniref:Uncharacterized protein n=1 Tax=Chrysochromulina tobinii TaxID=1460289 RepID=A0A0M0JIW1_9EUKA|nr:hypothetical protein Ctob_003641 [Chrysochromulina tobinii]|eukprot:KOO26526.1 hypothetical protein Ctob_003641 [Chrysochromulina sp. CCMP291]
MVAARELFEGAILLDETNVVVWEAYEEMERARGFTMAANRIADRAEAARVAQPSLNTGTNGGIGTAPGGGIGAAGVLKAIEGAGPLLSAAQLPGAVAAVFASLRAANESGVAALEARLEAARQRRAASEAERDALHARVAPLRSLVPSVSTDELLARLQVEVTKRQQLEAEFRVIKGHIEELADAQLLAPVQMEAAANALGKTAARLKEKIAPEAAEEA